ncbi:MAG: hypothetical protein C0483_10505 [Pirellula sp.]|nr:hypothetical protein [Pirellula sp.]
MPPRNSVYSWFRQAAPDRPPIFIAPALAPSARRIDVFELSQPDSSHLAATDGAHAAGFGASGNGGTKPTGEGRRPATLRGFVAGEENRLPLAAVEKFLDDAVSSIEHASDAAGANIDAGACGGLLVLHGPSGTGKTHLVETLLAQWSARLPEYAAVALSGSEFAEQYADAVEHDRIDGFQSRVRSADLFVLEDAGKLAAKSPAQWELLHTLDALEQRGAYVVLTLDAPPQTYDLFLPGLIGRLTAGFVFPLASPSQATRRALLAELATARGLTIDPKALDLLAADRETTVRELRGTLASLEAEALDHARREAAKTLFPLRPGEVPTIDLAIVRRFLANHGGGEGPTLKQIVEQTARHFGLRAADLKSGSRRRSVVTARDTAVFLARRLTKKSLQEIGEYFGGRDHTTILHSCRKLEAADELDPTHRATIATLRERLARG